MTVMAHGRISRLYAMWCSHWSLKTNKVIGFLLPWLCTDFPLPAGSVFYTPSDLVNQEFE